MTPDRPPLPDLYEMVHQLTSDHRHREKHTAETGRWVGVGTRDERYVVRTSWVEYHQTRVPALLMQLVGATPAGSESMSGTPPASRPAARIEALDTVMLVDDQAGEWLDRLGEVIPADRIDPATLLTVRGSGTVAGLRRLGARYRSLEHCGTGKAHRDKTKPWALSWCCPRHHLEADVRSWWHQARIMAGWDTPAFRPHNTCPICEQRDSLRIRPDAALCVECREVWAGPNELSILARHIQQENGDDTAA